MKIRHAEPEDAEEIHNVDFYGNVEGDEFDDEADRLIVVARK